MKAMHDNFFTADITRIDRSEALRYLAYGGSSPDERILSFMDKCEKKLLKAVKGKFTFRCFDISDISDNRVILENCSLIMTGKDICSHLEGCAKAVLMCATIGNDVDRLLREEQVSDMAAAVITDAMASCAVEKVCDAAEDTIRNEYPNMFMTWRFSAGYGDLPINIQKQFLEVTNAGRAIGLFANESSILIPRKSVTAVIGLSDMPIEKKRRGCAVCNLRESCLFRKKGRRCTDE